MSDPVDTLPAEFRTESLRSLPGDLKAIAVKNILIKFKLETPIIPKPETFTINSFDPATEFDLRQGISMHRYTVYADVYDHLKYRIKTERVEIVISDYEKSQWQGSIDYRYLLERKALSLLYQRYPSKFNIKILEIR